MRSLMWLSTGLVAGLGLAWGVTTGPNGTSNGSTAEAQTTPSAQTETRRVTPTSTAQVQLSYAPVVQRVSPSVVNIYTQTVIQRQPMMEDPFFRFFFGGRAEPRVQNSLGSGVIVRSDGLIVTNRHVVGDADEIRVVLADRREFEGKVLLQDERSDLALVKVDTKGKDLPVMKLGDSDKLQVGDITLAIGNPFGVGQTVTQGIVSAVRSGGGPTGYQYYIQTDAAINPGNSGGALVNLAGELIGLNTFIASPTGGSVGVGFAVPVNMIKSIIGAAGTGKIIRPWVGIEGQAVDSDIASGLGLERPRGVLINRLSSKSPAASAGLKVGDIITAIDGKEVSDINELQFRVATRNIGSTAIFTVLRNGKAQNIKVKLSAPPEIPPRDLTVLRGNSLFAGVKVGNLSPALSMELGGGLPDHGVVIMEMAANSPAARLGVLQPGDIIEAINGKAVSTVDQLEAQLARSGSGAVSFRFSRGGQQGECSVRPPAYISCRQ
ncbi:Do family serine endopeptidase [Pedomonas mirosovicensis]|uniref:Do family serine endopeptidase n=1 Tax=Pedomonas mirosovicensis TaxID=2908641 RepID=UPI00216A8275|nr:Do family serine endopeptidase [Pedomonas mirosovicensis]MCH8685998.1 Do family serine endopeptidase [Pedomonas mirosovicensis]